MNIFTKNPNKKNNEYNFIFVVVFISGEGWGE